MMRILIIDDEFDARHRKGDAYGLCAIVFDFSRNSCLWRLDHSLHDSIGIGLSLDAHGIAPMVVGLFSLYQAVRSS